MWCLFFETYKELSLRKEEHKKSISKLQNENAKLLSEKDHLEMEIETVNEELRRLRQESSKLERATNDAMARVNHFQNKNEDLEDTIAGINAIYKCIFLVLLSY